ncbi:MAG TPA: hypothetical protein DCG19_10950 [Cryomorphaceae bacterium]|nr:hypothetical protein [Owenweeksia sp.]MBF97890.1 hypothetical protein [Owenweeksia sp.]HAD97914.1 hypothetical protein [Cryomorphaceae bacterium]|tara:strand:- start:1945 stop:2319 length:375 start_codon:yes stop_codon:yes gene_type:complete
MKKSFLILTTAALAAFSTSCTKEISITDQKPDFNDAETTNDLDVPDGFTWKTVNEVEVMITPSSSGVMEIRDAEQNVYQKAFVRAGETFTTVISVPLALNSVELYFNGKSESISSSASKHTSQL